MAMKKNWKLNILLATGGIAFIVLLGERSEGTSLWAFAAVKAAAVAVIWAVSRVISRMQAKGQITLDDERA